MMNSIRQSKMSKDFTTWNTMKDLAFKYTEETT